MACILHTHGPSCFPPYSSFLSLSFMSFSHPFFLSSHLYDCTIPLFRVALFFSHPLLCLIFLSSTFFFAVSLSFHFLSFLPLISITVPYLCFSYSAIFFSSLLFFMPLPVGRVHPRTFFTLNSTIYLIGPYALEC